MQCIISNLVSHAHEDADKECWHLQQTITVNEFWPSNRALSFESCKAVQRAAPDLALAITQIQDRCARAHTHTHPTPQIQLWFLAHLLG